MIVVVNEACEWADGNVVYRWNEKHKVGTRTNYSGPRASMPEIRAAIAAVI